jgi:hypothetical protein
MRVKQRKEFLAIPDLENGLSGEIKMKIKALSLAAMLFAGAANALPTYTIGDGAINVGFEDMLVTTAYLSGGSDPESERQWVEGLLGGTITYLEKQDPLSYILVDQAGKIGAFELLKNADYFVIKDGKVKNTDPNKKTQHALFKNNDSFNWGVVDFYAIYGDKWDDLTISHVTEFNGKVTVSEPGSIALFLIALTGLGLARRYKKA